MQVSGQVPTWRALKPQYLFDSDASAFRRAYMGSFIIGDVEVRNSFMQEFQDSLRQYSQADTDDYILRAISPILVNEIDRIINQGEQDEDSNN